MQKNVKNSLLLLTLIFVLVISISSTFAQDLDNSTDDLAVFNNDESISIENQDEGYNIVSNVNDENEGSYADEGIAAQNDNNKLGYCENSNGCYMKFVQENITVTESEADYEMSLEEAGGEFMDDSVGLVNDNSQSTSTPLAEAYVDYANGNDTNDGASASTAFKTIEHALSAVEENGIVHVSGVNYLDGVGADGISIAKNISIIGLNDAVIDARSAGRIFSIGAYAVSLSNLAFINGNASNATDKRGGALYVNGATLTVDNCKFINNVVDVKSTYGGAINLKSSTTTIINSEFDGNAAWSTGGAINAENTNVLLNITGSTFTNNVLINNGWSAGAAICSYNTVIIDRSMFYGNRLTDASRNGKSINQYQTGSLTITNSILLDGEKGVWIATGPTTLENNWWGNNETTKNANPKDLGYTNANVTSYLYLSLSTDASDLKVNNQIDIDVKLISTGGSAVNLVDIPATVSSYQGTFVSEDLTLVNGAAIVKYTSNTVGDNVITADVLGIEDSLTLNFKDDYPQVVPSMPQVDSGVVSGGVDFIAVNPASTTGTLIYTVPDSITNLKSVIVIVNVYSGSGNPTYGLYSNVTLTTVNGVEVLGYETLFLDKATGNDPNVYGLNDHTNKQYSDYQMIYNITEKVSTLSSGDTITIDVANSKYENKSFDGRIKLIGLLFAYDDGDNDNYTYWLNAGQLWSKETANFTFETKNYTGKTDDISLRVISLSSSIPTFKINGVETAHDSVDSGTFTFKDFEWNNISSTFNQGNDTNFCYELTSGSHKISVALLVINEPEYVPLTEAYVDYAIGNDTNDGTSASTAFKTIEHALSIVEENGIIYVTGMNYLDDVGADGISIAKNISIIGLGNAAIDARGAGRIFNIGDYAVNLSNLAFINGNASNATDKRGGALYVNGATLTVDNCKFINNVVDVKSTYGGAINLKSSTTTIINSEFDGNAAWSTGGAINAENTNVLLNITGSTFTNNVLINNGWSAGAAICSYNTVIIDRSMFYGNRLTDASRNGKSINQYQTGSLTITNSILLDGEKGVWIATGPTTLENNWWGNNETTKDSTPKELNYTNADVESYLVLTTELSQDIIRVGDSVTVTTSLNKNQNGSAVGNLMELPMVLEANSGVIVPNMTTISTQSTSTYSAVASGADEIVVSVLGIYNALSFDVEEAVPNVVITSVTTPWSTGIFAGVNNTFTVKVSNNGESAVEGLILEIYSNETDEPLANFTIDSLAVGTDSIALTDPTIRPITEETIWPAAQSNKVKFTFNLKYMDEIISTISADKILAYDGYLNQSYAYDGHDNTINRNYTISGDIIVAVHGESDYRDQYSRSRNETWTIETPEGAEIVKVFLYFAYNWDTSYYPNGWNLTFNGQDINNQNIGYEMDRGNLGYYGSYNYGLVVFDVTDLYNVNDVNSFVINKTGNCALYPSTLFVLYNMTGSDCIKDVYFSDLCDVFYPYYNPVGYDDMLIANVNFNNIDLTNLESATLYAFAGSAGYNDTDLSFNDLYVSDAYPSSSDKECCPYIFDVTGGISQNNLARFITTAKSTTVVAYEQVLVVSKKATSADVNLNASYVVKVKDDGFTVNITVYTNPAITGNLTIKFNGNEYLAEVINGTANFVSNKVYSKTYPTEISYAGSAAYKNSTTSLDVLVKATKVTRENTFTYFYYNNDMGSDSEKGISKIKVVDVDGNPIKGGLVTITIMNKYKLKVKTDANGIAKFTKAYKPGTYSVTATYDNKVTKLGNLVLKSVVTVPKVTTVKKSAKTTTIKIKLKGTGPIKGKTVVVNFMKKNYKVKTDKNGIAQFKVTKDMVSKLGVGKTYKIRVTYRMDSVAQSIKIAK